MTEEWRPYPPAPDSYLVSESGAIYSRPRKVGGPYGSRKLKGRLLKPTFTPRGYPSYRVQVAGASKLIMAHAAVMEAFVGPRPEGMEVCHWDDNPKNNHVSNLRYSTHSENTLDSVRNGNHNNARKTHCSFGHEYTTDNTRYGKKHNGRYCIKCVNGKNDLRAAGISREKYRKLTMAGAMKVVELIQAGRRGAGV